MEHHSHVERHGQIKKDARKSYPLRKSSLGMSRLSRKSIVFHGECANKRRDTVYSCRKPIMKKRVKRTMRWPVAAVRVAAVVHHIHSDEVAELVDLADLDHAGVHGVDLDMKDRLSGCAGNSVGSEDGRQSNDPASRESLDLDSVLAVDEALKAVRWRLDGGYSRGFRIHRVSSRSLEEWAEFLCPVPAQCGRD